MKKVFLIINPTSGNYSPKILSEFVTCLEKLGMMTIIKITRYPGHARLLSYNAVKCGLYSHIIAGGGDGTIAEVAENLLGSSLVLGILPIGTANVLAHEFNIPFNVEKNAQLIAAGHSALIWPGYIKNKNNRFFFIQMVGIGLDAEIVRKNNKILKKFIGKLSYVMTGILCFFRYKMDYFDLYIDGQIYKSTFAIVSKGMLYGGRFKIFNQGCHNDQYFSILIFKSKSKIALIYSVLSLVFFGKKNIKYVTFCEAFAVKIRSNQKIPVQSDGDAKCETSVNIYVSQKSLNAVSF